MEDKYICKYCLGCQIEELDDFKLKMNCKGFVPAYDDWQEKYYERLKGVKNGL